MEKLWAHVYISIHQQNKLIKYEQQNERVYSPHEPNNLHIIVFGPCHTRQLWAHVPNHYLTIHFIKIVHVCILFHNHPWITQPPSLAVASPEASGGTKLGLGWHHPHNHQLHWHNPWHVLNSACLAAGYLWKPGEYGITVFISVPLKLLIISSPSISNK